MKTIKNRPAEQTLSLLQADAGKISSPALSVVIPAYNEAAVIGGLLEELRGLAEAHDWEIIVVDDGSTDDTAQQIDAHLDVRFMRVIRHPYNRGYGAALKSGIRAAVAPLIATLDADGQHDPHDLLKLLTHSDAHDLVVGERPGLIHSKFWRMPGKWLLGWLANYLSRQKIPDLNSGMRLFRTQTIRKYLHLCSDSFSFSTTSTLVCFNRGYPVKYVPITISPRPPASRSTVRLRNGFDTIVLILRLASLFQPLRVFIPASLSFMVLGVLWGMRYVFLMRGISVGAMLLILTGLLLFFFGLLTDQVAQLRMEKYE